MHVSNSYLTYTDIGYCITCEAEVWGPFDLCRNCYPIYKEDLKVPWMKTLRNNAQKRRRQSVKDSEYGLMSLDKLMENAIVERKL